MLDGPRITLRPWCDEDLDFFARLRNDVDTQLELLAVPRPNPTHRVRKWLEDRSNAVDGVFFVIASKSGDRAVGFVELRNIHPTHCWGDLGISLDRTMRGQGLASEALELIESYAHRVLMLRKIVLIVAATNEAARRLYDGRGYVTVGIHRQHYRVAGEWLDAVVMEMPLNVDAANNREVNDVTSHEQTVNETPLISPISTAANGKRLATKDAFFQTSEKANSSP